MAFVPAFLPESDHTGRVLWFIFSGDEILLKDNSRTFIPTEEEIHGIAGNLLKKHYFGTLDGAHCYSAEIPAGAETPRGMSFHGLRPLLWTTDGQLFPIAGRAFQIIHWDRTHQFCGRCGGHMSPRQDELAKACSVCGLLSYPEVTPAIIVAVTRGREILLARSHRFSGTFFSVLAGFVEPGETFEECVRREVREEVGIEIDNLRYFGSQSWPFPHSLMAGFTAEYAGGEISPDEAEISEAGWFTPETLPELPRAGSIARQLIERFKSSSNE